MTLDRVRIIELPRIHTAEGNLTFIEGGLGEGALGADTILMRHIPFDVKRVFYLYDVPGGGKRGRHAHKTLEQFIVPIAGSFSLTLDDGYSRKNFFLNRAFQGVYVPSHIWCELDDFASGSVCLVLASDYYAESDYYRVYADFLHAVRDVVR